MARQTYRERESDRERERERGREAASSSIDSQAAEDKEMSLHV